MEFLHVKAVEGGIDVAQVAPQLRLLFDEEDLEVLPRELEGGRHAGEAASDDEGCLVDADGDLLERLDVIRVGDRHATSVFAFSVAPFWSFMWTQEHWSRMLAISKRYLLRPASRMVERKRNSCVLGEQEATITLFRLYSLITCFIFSCVSWEQVKRFSSAMTTLGEASSIFLHLGHVDHRSYVDAAVADEDADPRLFGDKTSRSSGSGCTRGLCPAPHR